MGKVDGFFERIYPYIPSIKRVVFEVLPSYQEKYLAELTLFVGKNPQYEEVFHLDVLTKMFDRLEAEYLDLWGLSFFAGDVDALHDVIPEKKITPCAEGILTELDACGDGLPNSLKNLEGRLVTAFNYMEELKAGVGESLDEATPINEDNAMVGEKSIKELKTVLGSLTEQESKLSSQLREVESEKSGLLISLNRDVNVGGTVILSPSHTKKDNFADYSVRLNFTYSSGVLNCTYCLMVTAEVEYSRGSGSQTVIVDEGVSENYSFFHEGVLAYFGKKYAGKVPLHIVNSYKKVVFTVDAWCAGDIDMSLEEVLEQVK